MFPHSQEYGLDEHQLMSLLFEIHQAEGSVGRQNPEILHWSKDSGGLVAWEWPCYDDATSCKVPPDELEEHRQVHYFRGPCCLCAYIQEGLVYSECKITLIEPVSENKNDPGRRPFIGEYIAECATGACGYFVALERLFSNRFILVRSYVKRPFPCPPEALRVHLTSESNMYGGGDSYLLETGAGFRTRVHQWPIGHSASACAKDRYSTAGGGSEKNETQGRAGLLNHTPEWVSTDLDDLETDSEEEKEMDEVIGFLHAAMFPRKRGGRSFAGYDWTQPIWSSS